MMPLWATWWAWLSGALLLGILEVLAPGYVFLGFAVGAGVIGTLLWLEFLPAALPIILVVFAVMSLVAYLLFRKFSAPRGGTVKRWTKDINDN